MIVRELIEFLSTLPPDLVVTYRAWSDLQEMEAADIAVLTAESRKVVKRHGKYAYTYPGSMWPPDEQPQYTSVVEFPGN